MRLIRDVVRAILGFLVCGLLTGLMPALAYDGNTLWLTERALVGLEASIDASTHRMASDGAGGVVVVWEDRSSSGSIYAQRLDHQGERQWLPLEGKQLWSAGEHPQIWRDGPDFFVVWEDAMGVWIQKMDDAGNFLFGIPTHVGSSGGHYPSVVGDGLGGAFVAFHLGAVEADPRLAHIDATGTPTDPGIDGVALGGTMCDTRRVRVVPTYGNGVIVVWASLDSGCDIVARRFPNVAAWGTTPVVISNDARDERSLAVASDGEGGVLVAWNAHSPDVQVRAQRVNNVGQPLWAANGIVLLDNDEVGGEFWPYWEVLPLIVSDGDGGAIVAWDDYRSTTPGNPESHVRVQRVSAGGNVLWNNYGVLASRPIGLSQRDPHIVADGAGGVIVTFQTDTGAGDIGVARLDLDGNRHWSELYYFEHVEPHYEQIFPRLIFETSGPSPHGAIVSWLDREDDAIYALKIEISRAAHDDCSDAGDIGTGDYESVLAGATLDGASSCGGGGAGADRWGRFVAPSYGILRVDTCGTHDLEEIDGGVDTVLSLHSACPGTPENELPDGCNDNSTDRTCDSLDHGDHRDSSVSAALEPGQEVLIRVSRHATSTNGPFRLHVGFEWTPAPNDNCEGMVDVRPGSYFGNLDGAGTEGDASCSATWADLWYRYRAPADGFLHVNTCGTNDMHGTDLGTNTVLSLHGSCPGHSENQWPEACNDNWPTSITPNVCAGIDHGTELDSAVTVPIADGQTVVIRVARHAESYPDQFVLNVVHAVPAGAVPDAHDHPVRPLRLDKLTDGEIELQWDPSCLSTDDDYAIYAGSFADFGYYEPITCYTGAQRSWSLVPPATPTFYLVVPTNGFNEGSYGLLRSGGVSSPRAPSPLACLRQLMGECPP